MKEKERKACPEKQKSVKCSFFPEREWRQVKERAFTTPSKIGDKEEGEGEIILSFLWEAEQQCQDLRS